jgi:ATP adenylyltransferase
VALYYLGNHRSAEQLAEMVRLEAGGVCLFCPEHLGQDVEHPSVLETAHWTVTPNRYPYNGTRLHLLLIPHEHVTDLVDLSAEAREDFWRALGWVRDHYTLTYYGLGARNGDCRFTGGTVHHLHVHLVVGDVDDPQHQPVRMKLSSRPPAGAAPQDPALRPRQR